METIKSMPKLLLDPVSCSDSTSTSSKNILDISMIDSATPNAAKPVASETKRNPDERIQRSRERNRIHARKTRQRKKEQLQSLQSKAEYLKGEQMTLKLSINEKHTATILCCLFLNNQGSQQSCAEDPRVEELLQRPEEEIPDPSKLPALQPLILPSGAQHSKKSGNDDAHDDQQEQQEQQLPDDGIDYELLGKDRSKCTPSELDQIRRERNRMHAKRTRDRKRLFMEEMADMCKALEGENLILQLHLNELNGVNSKPEPTLTSADQTQTQTTSAPVAPVSPFLSPTTAPTEEPSSYRQESSSSSSSSSQTEDHHESILPLTSQNCASFDQMKTLLDAAGVFDLNSNINSINNSSKNMNMDSCAVSVSSEDHGDDSSRPLKKRRRFHPCSTSSDEDGGD